MAGKTEPSTDQLLVDFLSGDYSHFEDLVATVDGSWREYGRNLPAGLYESIRRSLVLSLMDVGGDAAVAERREPLKLRVVIDTNTIVLEAFRVARGRKSSTPRLFDSPFVELYAPVHIREETQRIIHEKLPRGANEKNALAHASQLLQRVKILPNLTEDAIARARQTLMPNAPEDVPFLAVAFDTKSPYIVSTDRAAFDGLSSVERWYLRDFSTSVVSLEVGGLSLVLLGAGAEGVFATLEVVAVAVAKALYDILAVLAQAAAAIVKGAADAINRVPAWAGWLVLGLVIGVSLYVGIRALLDEEFRERVVDTFSEVANAATRAFGAVLGWIRAALDVLWNVLKWIWSVIKPLARASLLVAYVLTKETKSFLDVCEKTVAEAEDSP